MKHFMQFVKAAALFAFVLCLLAGCTAQPTGISMAETLLLEKGTAETLTATLTFDRELSEEKRGEALAKHPVTFTSSDETVATVDESGVVTAVNGGTAVVTAAVNDKLQAQCAVRVTVSVREISVPKEITLFVNDEEENSAHLNAQIIPSDADNQELLYASDNADIATVDGNGTVTAVSNGRCAITASTPDGKAAARSKVEVKVKATGIALNGTGATIAVGGAATISPHTLPVEAPASTYTFVSGDAKIATVNGDGVVTGKATGSTSITVTSAEGLTAEYAVTVAVKCGYCGGLGHAQASCPAYKAALAKQAAAKQAAAQQAAQAASAEAAQPQVETPPQEAPVPPPQPTAPPINDSPWVKFDPDAGNDVTLE